MNYAHNLGRRQLNHATDNLGWRATGPQHAPQHLALTRWLALPMLSFVLSGCLSSSSGSAAANSAQNYNRASTPWFCQVDINYAGWDCVRDTDEASRPTPRRIPVAGKALPAGSADSTTGADARTVDAEATGTVLKQAPKHVRLSYQPEEPVAILDLPATYWIVQLISVSDKAALEKYAAEHGLHGMSAARVWAKEQFFYVLILGVYETYDIAREASSELPPPFDEQKPWIRSVGSLQKAMLDADRMAGNSQP